MFSSILVLFTGDVGAVSSEIIINLFVLPERNNHSLDHIFCGALGLLPGISHLPLHHLHRSRGLRPAGCQPAKPQGPTACRGLFPTREAGGAMGEVEDVKPQLVKAFTDIRAAYDLLDEVWSFG